MGRSVTSAEILSRARLAAEAQNDTNITDAWLYLQATALVAKLWDLIIANGLGGEGVKNVTFTSVQGQVGYDLNASIWTPPGGSAGPLADFYKVKTLYAANGTGLLRPVPRVSPNEEYAMRGPSMNLAMKLYYIPVAPVWSTGAETFDGINGYEEWIVQGLAYAIRVKREDDGGPHKGLQREVEQQIEFAANRNADEPPRIIRRRTAQTWIARTIPYSGGVSTWDLRGGNLELYAPYIGLYP
jgi:hypothetical protein